MYTILNAVLMAVGNLNEADVKFPIISLPNLRTSLPDLQEQIFLHYKNHLMPQLFRILGSADFLGNPVGLFTNITSGITDVFYEPYLGATMHGNRDIGLGIARGVTSLGKKTVFGVSDSLSKVSGSIGKGLAAASFDSNFQARRRANLRRNRPKHAM